MVKASQPRSFFVSEMNRTPFGMISQLERSTDCRDDVAMTGKKMFLVWRGQIESLYTTVTWPFISMGSPVTELNELLVFLLKHILMCLNIGSIVIANPWGSTLYRFESGRGHRLLVSLCWLFCVCQIISMSPLRPPCPHFALKAGVHSGRSTR